MNEKEIKKQIREIFPYGHPEFYELVWRMYEIHSIKNKGYGLNGNPLGNFMMSETFGVPAWKGCLVRMSDKWSRICNLTSKMNDPGYKDAVSMESIEDTLLDLANYSLLCLILLRESKKQP
jgi:hypothetical protein